MRAMRFSLFLEFQKAGPWGDGVDAQLFQESLDQVVLADQLGWDGVWLAEHHFLPEYARSPRPDLFLAYVAAKTTRLRIGHGVVVLPVNHPLRVAEGIATLDVLSGGRVEFGTGRGGLTSVELAAFGADVQTSREMWDEAVHMIPRMWSSTIYEHDGKYWKVPPVEVLPRPVQRPHPPMWLAVLQPESYEIAGRRGLGILCLGGGNPRTLTRLFERYDEGLAHVEPAGAFVTNRRAVQVNGLCGEDDAETVAFTEWHSRWYYNNASGANIRTWFDRDDVPESYRWYVDRAREGRTMVSHIAGLTAQEMRDGWNMVAGDPEYWVRAMKQYEAIGADEVLILMQIGRMPHERIMRSIELIATEVIPKFRG
jgi:alkanesulfonate monooxygenase SsuD/methylene tetrahydromethanopterin reductase-like flavin-dependent oxidoreductase (luciferase family)